MHMRPSQHHEEFKLPLDQKKLQAMRFFFSQPLWEICLVSQKWRETVRSNLPTIWERAGVKMQKDMKFESTT